MTFPEWLAGVGGVEPLEQAEGAILQVLLAEFNLVREQGGVRLRVAFGPESPAIRRRETRSALRGRMPGFGSAPEVQRALEEVLLDGTRERYDHQDHGFPFRYASGGALPLIVHAGKEHYGLFYRDIHPQGWNIANGSCDSLGELIDPRRTIEREFREELIVLEPAAHREHVPAWQGAWPAPCPEADLARVLWRPRLGEAAPRAPAAPIEVEWLGGGDSLTVCWAGREFPPLGDCLVNVNALDFGIEVDRIARFRLPDGALLLDGEVSGGRLLDRPIGLFERGRLESLARAPGPQDLLPDVLFFAGARRAPERLEALVLDEFLPALIAAGLRPPESRARFRALAAKYGLCPVTRQLVLRRASAQAISR